MEPENKVKQTTTWWEISSSELQEVEVESATDKFVTVNGRRQARFSESFWGSGFFQTKLEAKRWKLGLLSKELERLNREVEKIRGKIANLETL